MQGGGYGSLRPDVRRPFNEILRPAYDDPRNQLNVQPLGPGVPPPGQVPPGQIPPGQAIDQRYRGPVEGQPPATPRPDLPRQLGPEYARTGSKPRKFGAPRGTPGFTPGPTVDQYREHQARRSTRRRGGR